MQKTLCWLHLTLGSRIDSTNRTTLSVRSDALVVPVPSAGIRRIVPRKRPTAPIALQSVCRGGCTPRPVTYDLAFRSSLRRSLYDPRKIIVQFKSAHHLQEHSTFVLVLLNYQGRTHLLQSRRTPSPRARYMNRRTNQVSTWTPLRCSTASGDVRAMGNPHRRARSPNNV